MLTSKAESVVTTRQLLFGKRERASPLIRREDRARERIFFTVNLESLHFFDFLDVAVRLFIEFRAILFGTNFDFSVLVHEGYWSALLLPSLIAHHARFQGISLRTARHEHETKGQRDMLESIHELNYKRFGFRTGHGWMLRSRLGEMRIDDRN